jgi:hypothetical protein
VTDRCGSDLGEGIGGEEGCVCVGEGREEREEGEEEERMDGGIGRL